MKLPGDLKTAICAIPANRDFPAASTGETAQVARGAGKVLSVFSIILLVATLFPLTSGAAADAKAGSQAYVPPQEDLLIPGRTLNGGWMVSRQDQNGVPIPGAFKGFANFIFPSALSAHAPDLYIADAGTRKVYRYNNDMQALSVMAGIDATTVTRLQAGPDQSLFVLDPARSLISRYSRGGQKLQMLSSPVSTARLTEFVLDESIARIFAVDQLNGQLVPLRPLGSADMPMISAGSGEIKVMGALARTGGVMYVVDTACVCVVSIDESGQVLERFGQGDLIQPRAMVADKYGRVFVADGFDRTLKIFMQGILISSYPPGKLHVTEITALAIDQGTLYVADGPGAKVLTFRVRSPGN